MRKVTILTVLLVCVAFVGAYAETVVEPSVSGDVTLTYGVDLNDPITHGFEAENNVVAELVLTDGYSAEKGSDDAAVYGWIAFEDVSFGLSNNMSEGSGDDADFYDVEDADGDAWNAEVTGRIMFGDVAWLQIYSASEEAFDYATMVSLDPETADQVAGTGQQITLDGLEVEDGAEGQDHDDYPGVTLGVDVDPVMFKLYWMDTDEGFTAKGKDVSNGWLIGMSADVDVSIITFNLYAGTMFGAAEGAFLEDGLSFGSKVGLDLAMGGGMGIDNTLGADFALQKGGDDTDFYWELSNNFAFGLTEDEDGDIASSVALDVSFAPALYESKISGDVPMGDLDVGFSITEDQSDGLLSGLEASAYFNLLDLLGKNADTGWGMGMEFGAAVAYKAMLDDTYYVEPGAGFGYDMGIMDADYALNEEDMIMDMYFQVETMVIPNTTFTLRYATDQLLDEMTAAGTGHMAQDTGAITLATEISF